MEDETLRNWAFMSDTIPPPNIWARYDTKTILGMERISWQLRPKPEVGWYRLRRYTLPTYASSLYWLHFEWDEGSKTSGNTASVSIPKTHKGPPGPGASGPSGAAYMSDKGASTSGHCNMTFKGTYGASSSGPCNKTFMSDKVTEAQLRGVMDVSDNHSLHSSLLILSRALRLSGRINADDAVRATLSSIAWDTASLPSEDSVSELRRKLQDEYVQGDEGEEMTIDIVTASKAQEHARGRVPEQQDDLCKLSCALALLASTSLGCRERGELLRLLTDEVEFYYTMVEKATEADEVSYALMEKVDKLMQNFEKELFGEAFQLLARDGLQAI
ncbi:PREDICTED: uncharacterized protein LOC104749337 [Camelina sativa]|uniref:Uncharacterized protein LOC104749337 n=1 Tax=Camelina sativa TaxID=90675 RepID=A0ABM0WCU5_CAMSA|nr:PREDICTED: uncharacterized protein LOC104749337 [Camelina sativa]